jgi:hypothetical protein
MSYKEFDQSSDVSTQRGVVNEVIPLTGTFFSGVANFYTKTYLNIVSGSVLSGGFFQTVYDGAPTSVSASALIDLTYGHSSASVRAGYTETFENAEKQRVYQQMAQLLLGSKSSVFSFDNTPYHELFFFLFKRRIFKDEVQKGQLSINYQMSGSGANNSVTLYDTGAATAYDVGPAGDESDLFSGSTVVGRVYYNIGVVALVTGAFCPDGADTFLHWSGSGAGLKSVDQTTISGNIDSAVYGLRQHINNLQFQNQTNLHSTLYFCRALNSDFNYSTNSTFVDSDGRIVVTSGTDNQTRTYVTSIGLYDINDNLLAIAKTSEPVKKSPDNEIIFRVRLTY